MSFGRREENSDSLTQFDLDVAPVDGLVQGRSLAGARVLVEPLALVQNAQLHRFRRLQPLA